MQLKILSFQPCTPTNLPQLEERSMEQMQEQHAPAVDLSHPTLSSDHQLLTPSLDGMSHLGRH
jgi:hypothetical protein